MNSGPLDKFRLDGKVERLRSDEGGSLTLLAGMMVFLVTIFAMIAFDTNKAIYDRILAQNAVDSAADSAALWQARACNLLQELNNVHNTVDTVAEDAEIAATVACIAAIGEAGGYDALLDSLILAEAAPAVLAAGYITCTVCETLPYVDVYQNMIYNAIAYVQYGIIVVDPYLVFGNANACAEGSGADPLLAVAASGLQSFCSMLGIQIPDISSVTSVLGNVKVYAFPLDPSAVGIFDPQNTGLYVKPKENSGSPLYFSQATGDTGEPAGDAGCEPGIWEGAFEGTVLIGPPGFGIFEDADAFHSEYTKTDPFQDLPYGMSNETQRWGWNDRYYFGWPGYMTWIAGVEGQNELLNLGNLAWFNGGNNVPSTFYTQNSPVKDQASMPTYTGQAQINTSSPLAIPAYLAIASSQVEGTTVISDGDVNAVPQLIRVYLPFPSQSTNRPGTDLPFPITIYH
ncbi:MAG TPA: hypothetical protein VMH87_18915 [Pseudomonadales bacterium]|nr:hypothetical protein [Pseudomonadales bacterium]